MSEQAWHVHSRAISEVVRAGNQFEAWDTLRDRPVEDFGLVVTAEADENADPIPVRTSGLMYSWGRDEDAAALIRLAIENGLPDTTEVDRLFRGNKEAT